jgi:hypothetical protein
METADVAYATSPLQNCLARCSGRKIDVKTPVRRGCRMPQDVGIRPLDDVIHMEGAGPKARLSIPILCTRGSAPHEGDARETKQNASAPLLLIFDRIGIGAYFPSFPSFRSFSSSSSCKICSASFPRSRKSLRPVSSKLLSSPFCADGISVVSSAPLTV